MLLCRKPLTTQMHCQFRRKSMTRCPSSHPRALTTTHRCTTPHGVLLPHHSNQYTSWAPRLNYEMKANPHMRKLPSTIPLCVLLQILFPHHTSPRQSLTVSFRIIHLVNRTLSGLHHHNQTTRRRLCLRLRRHQDSTLHLSPSPPWCAFFFFAHDLSETCKSHCVHVASDETYSHEWLAPQSPLSQHTLVPAHPCPSTALAFRHQRFVNV